LARHNYYLEDRTHIGLAKQTASGRKTAVRKDLPGKVVSLSRLGGLHHRYDLAA
jgi:hypothetical protein